MRFAATFPKGFMNHQNWLNLATALVTTTTLSMAATSAVASDLEQNQNFWEHVPELTTNSTSVIPEITQTQDLVKAGEVQLPTTKRDGEAEVIAKVYTYQLDNVTASTIYVKSIPVLTFLENAPQANKEQAKSLNLREKPVAAAKNLVNRLNQLHQQQIDANQITASWDAASASYVIKVQDQPLVAINKQTILADTTNKPAEDALQATNRLRRLLGNAQPLAAIAGKPQPQVQQVAMANTGNVVQEIKGMASWYGPGFHGRRSANGERFNQNALTAAHKTLPFGTKVRVTNLYNNRSVVVRINDRGPYSGRRVIDLSAAAAREIGMIGSGVANVKLEVLEN